LENGGFGARCKNSCEVLYDTETECIVDMDCMWDPERMMCTLTCAEIDKNPRCDETANCRWKSTSPET
jgi:hypothetical protein